MDRKLPEETVRSLLLPWRFSFRAAGFQDRLLLALQLFQKIPLDVAVTGGTPEANAQLAAAICRMQAEQDLEEVELESDDNDEDEEEDETDDDDDDYDEVNGTDEKDEQSDCEKCPKKVYISEMPENIGNGDSVLLHREIPGVRVWMVQGHPISNCVFKRSEQSSESTYYDVLVVLTTEQRGEDHVWLKMEAQERALFLVRAEQEWDVVEEKPCSPCSTCAWERKQERNLELQRRRAEDSAMGGDAELVEMKDMAKVFAEALPELKKKAFSHFMITITKELWLPKLLSEEPQIVVSTALRSGKISATDLEQISKLSQGRDLTDSPSKLQAILSALDHFRLDVGVLGETGCGSSSLVNALLGLEELGEEQAASTGVTETTQEPWEHPYPEASNIRLWDLPGLGKLGDLAACSFNEAQRVADLLSVCDVYIIMSALRLKSASVQLLQQASSLGKECYLVLSMADLLEESSVLEVREWTEGVLAKLGLQHRLFVLSTHHPEMFDFCQLKEALNAAFPHHKNVAMARYAAKQLDRDVFWKRSDSCDIM